MFHTDLFLMNIRLASSVKMYPYMQAAKLFFLMIRVKGMQAVLCEL